MKEKCNSSLFGCYGAKPLIHKKVKRFNLHQSVGFEPLITLTEMWDEENPCLIMFKPLVQKP